MHEPKTTPTRANLGPLTTTFTAPKRCTDAMHEPSAAPLGGAGRLAQTCYNDHMIDDTACWPSPPTITKGVLSSPTPTPPWAGGVYTPGLVCPNAHTTACSATAGVDGGFTFQFGLEPGETAMGCCPR